MQIEFSPVLNILRSDMKENQTSLVFVRIE